MWKMRKPCLVDGSTEGHTRQKCLRCKAIFMKEYRKNSQAYAAREKRRLSLRPAHRHKAHNLIRDAIVAGEILPATAHKCIVCGNQAQVWDHRDYLKPMEVLPVCRSCNKKLGTARHAVLSA